MCYNASEILFEIIWYPNYQPQDMKLNVTTKKK